MRDLARAWDILRDGRPIPEVALRLAAAVALLTVLWACACAFMLMEPLP